MTSQSVSSTEVTTADLETNATTKIGELVPEDLDGITKDGTFRGATAALLAGQIKVGEWEWFAVRRLNRLVDIPYVGEATEKGLFSEAFEAVGALLEGLLLTTSKTKFRAATLDLLQGNATTEEWLDAAADVLDALVDISYLPRVGEEMIFDRGLELIAKALHGLLTGGSAK